MLLSEFLLLCGINLTLIDVICLNGQLSFKEIFFLKSFPFLHVVTIFGAFASLGAETIGRPARQC